MTHHRLSSAALLLTLLGACSDAEPASSAPAQGPSSAGSAGSAGTATGAAGAAAGASGAAAGQAGSSSTAGTAGAAGAAGGEGGSNAAGGSSQGAAGAAPSRQSPDPWANELAPTRLQDRNPDPRIVEVDLEAAPATWAYAPGKQLSGIAYNGVFPGPLLEASVGDHVIVHFTNSLSEPTSIHWHGVRVPVDVDGAHHPVAPGEKLDYEFDVLDAGTFWYHPHFNESGQMDRGLKGPIVFRGADEPQVDAEGVLFLDDILIDETGEIAPFQGSAEIMLGREGNFRLINGKSEPTIPIRAGATQRWRVINSSGARFWRLSLEGHELVQLGTDGSRLAKPATLPELMVVPGERADLLVRATGAPGSTAALSTLPYNRGHGGGTTKKENVATLAYSADEPLSLEPAPGPTPGPESLDVSNANARTIKLSEGTGPDGKPIFMINDKSAPDVPAIETKLGAVELWDIFNDSPMDHPFHLHGFFFEVLERDGVAEPVVALRDSVNIKAHTHTKIAFRPENHPGMWMYHCHILQHLDHGMMGEVSVAP